ncbi:MAG: helix-turn-helix domain-containing protein [Cyclobacteriaceae bacterium]
MKNEAVLERQLKLIGEKLAELRRKKGYSSHESFAYDFELPRVQYWRMEKGKSNITIKSLLRIMEIHSLSLKEFFNSLPKENT